MPLLWYAIVALALATYNIMIGLYTLASPFSAVRLCGLELAKATPFNRDTQTRTRFVPVFGGRSHVLGVAVCTCLGKGCKKRWARSCFVAH